LWHSVSLGITVNATITILNMKKRMVFWNRGILKPEDIRSVKNFELKRR